MVLAVVALGGIVGVLGRYGLAELVPYGPSEFPWATFATNLAGCLLIGVLMVLVTEAWAAHRLLRPFLGVGVLGGFTTFSTYAVETHGLARHDAYALAITYALGTVIGALAAVIAGVWLARAVIGRD